MSWYRLPNLPQRSRRTQRILSDLRCLFILCALCDLCGYLLSSRCGFASAIGIDLFERLRRGLANLRLPILCCGEQGGDGLLCFRADATKAVGRFAADKRVSVLERFAQGWNYCLSLRLPFA